MFLDIFDHADEGLAEGGGGGGGGGGEEELEWLANKDAFPALETSFDAADAPVLGAWASAPAAAAAAAAAARVPVRPRSKGRRRRRSGEGAAAAAAGPAGPRRRCRHCAAEETPQWRAGPEGPKTLCNACGVRFKSGRLVPEYRPARSPTFVPALHSNSHRRILEMRRLHSPAAAARGGRRGRGRGGGRRAGAAPPLPNPIC
ncbi:GATA transcription factor 9 [Ananas comosus]|uniref:GATA transcription factor 9 n=1 Tax=Ananas comosus TaxID=4615 RepID=A0A199UIS5_ANACO|nr:GATA transcription factor 9 [Ananas comosus]